MEVEVGVELELEGIGNGKCEKRGNITEPMGNNEMPRIKVNSIQLVPFSIISIRPSVYPASASLACRPESWSAYICIYVCIGFEHATGSSGGNHAPTQWERAVRRVCSTPLRSAQARTLTRLNLLTRPAIGSKPLGHPLLAGSQPIGRLTNEPIIIIVRNTMI